MSVRGCRGAGWLAGLLVTVCAVARDAETGGVGDGERFMAVVAERFAAWDADGDAVVTAAELNGLVADPAVKGDEAAAVAALKRATRSRKVMLPPLTRANLEDLARRKRGAEWPDFAAMFAGGRRRIGEANRVLFASGLPRLETVRQGRMGNCFCLAPLGALTYHRPEYVVEEMIQRLADGRYQVRLGKEIIIVPAPTDAELALTAGNESDGYWVNVYEKAAGVARNAQRPPEEREANGLDVLNRGGSAGTQLAFITGHEMFRLSCKFAKDEELSAADYEAKLKEIREALTAATRERRLMTCGTLKTTVPGITPNHAYAVLSYAAANDCIRVWNPHGDNREVKGEPGPELGYPMKDGVLELPLTVFVKEFSGLAFEVLP
jgi:hypothetical protein